MVIKQCFSVLKNCFHVLKEMPKYKVCHQPLVVNACCALYNFICLVDCDDVFFLDCAAEEVVDNGSDLHDLGFDFSEAAAIAMSNTRGWNRTGHVGQYTTSYNCFLCLHCACLV
jgi:hypothetical protein